MPSLTTAANPSDSLPISRASPRGATSESFVFAAAWLVAIAIAFALDRPLALWLRDNGIANAVKFGGYWRNAARLAGYFWFSLGVAAALLIWHPLRWRAALFMLLCAGVGGTNSILKWIVGRSRPFKLPPLDLAQPFRCSPFIGGLRGLVHQSNDLSFVSGHTALAFATAAGLAVLFPKTRAIVYLGYSIAVIVLLERVGENAHWLSDAVCGAALGVWGVALLARYCTGLLRGSTTA
jgi:membrane-associated phospholipid phosphatase